MDKKPPEEQQDKQNKRQQEQKTLEEQQEQKRLKRQEEQRALEQDIITADPAGLLLYWLLAAVPLVAVAVLAYTLWRSVTRGRDSPLSSDSSTSMRPSPRWASRAWTVS